MAGGQQCYDFAGGAVGEGFLGAGFDEAGGEVAAIEGEVMVLRVDLEMIGLAGDQLGPALAGIEGEMQGDRDRGGVCPAPSVCR